MLSEIMHWTLFQWVCIGLLVLILLRVHFGLAYVVHGLRTFLRYTQEKDG